MVTSSSVIVRSLNYLRSIHLPTYVALRMLLKSVPGVSLDAFVDGIVTQATIRRSPRVLELKRFKSLRGDEYVYRDYSVPSPTSALADSYAIGILQEHGIVPRRDYVYSYRDPLDREYPKSFEHFSVGYSQRNEAIALALDLDNSVAVVVDIRGFYPSVDAVKAMGILQERLGKSKGVSKRDRAIVMASAERAIAKSVAGARDGLRVGPEMSHILADFALQNVDSQLCEAFRGSYFRYVDDIVVVVKKSEAQAARVAVGDILSREGYAVSVEKDAVVGRDEWNGYRDIQRGVVSGASTSLNHLKFRTKLFLAKSPNAATELRSCLSDAGVFLPIGQLADASRQRAWRYRVSSLFSRRWRVVSQYWGDSIFDITNAAIECKRDVSDELNRILDDPSGLPDAPVSRKWRIQHARLAINRSLYFSNLEELSRIASYAESIPELVETQAVCRALLGDPAAIVNMPGPAVAAFAQVASVRGQDFPAIDVDGSAVEPGILADVAANLAIRSGRLPVRGGLEVGPDFAGLLAFAACEKFPARKEGALGYGDEVSAIGVNSSWSDLAEAASTRFSSQEDVVLDALTLSTNYVS